jgi:hypothetical protein
MFPTDCETQEETGGSQQLSAKAHSQGRQGYKKIRGEFEEGPGKL